MSLPNRIAAYDDCFEVYEKALASGVRVAFKTYGEAKIYVMRMHQARALLADESRRMYPKEDPRWGKTDFDRLMVRHPVEDTEGSWWVYIERHGANILAVEVLESPPPFQEASDETSNLS